MNLSNGTTTVRAATDGDIETLLTVLNDPEVTRWWPADEFDDIAATLDGRDDDAVGAIIEHDGAIAGFVQYYEIEDPQYRHAGIDILVADGFRNRGVGPAAIRLLTDWLFDECGHHRIVIDPNAANPRAIRAYEKVGFKVVGTLREYEYDRHRGEWTDGVLMEMLASERP